MPDAKTYLVSLAVGILVGVIYGLLGVRSPAPPLVALVGLLGILVGEQVVPVARQLLRPEAATLSSLGSDCAHHMLGALPGSGRGAAPPAVSNPSSGQPEQSV
jgi:XapX domain-containing protein